MPSQNSLLLYLSVKTIENASAEKQNPKHSNAKMQMQST